MRRLRFSKRGDAQTAKHATASPSEDFEETRKEIEGNRRFDIEVGTFPGDFNNFSCASMGGDLHLAWESYESWLGAWEKPA